jgi:WD repeat and SOF domain-containing protein 1
MINLPPTRDERAERSFEFASTVPTMKVKALSRSIASTERECSGDVRRQFRNLDATSHPMQRAREYQRAVTGAKLDRMFAKPLVGSLGDGHMDGITASATSRKALVPFVSASVDGQVRLWDLASRRKVAELNAHSRVVNGVVFDVEGQRFYSCGDDGFVKLWSASPQSAGQGGPLETWRTNGTFKSIDHHWQEPEFATASDSSVQIWTPERSASIQTHSDLWGTDDTVNVVRYNPAERNLLAHCSADRGIGLFDIRTGTALKKVVLRMRSNCLEWNPMEPMNFVVGNEDYQAYSFDMRKLDQPTRIYKGHQGAILSVSWSPTGREIVTGSYDRTLRIFEYNRGTARDIYHAKRMQRVFTVHYTLDNKFILSGSDDTNIRIWKSHASEQLGQRTSREEAAVQYRQALVKKYQHLPEVKRISKSRKIPKVIKKQTAQTQIQKESADRKQSNRVKHSKPGTVKFESERKKVVVKQVE